MDENDLLPRESEVTACLESQLAEEFNIARDLLRLGLLLTGLKDLNKSSLPHDSVVTVLGIYVKATITFRAIIHLCESGLDRCALPLSRSLFENCLYLSFLARRKVSLFRFNDSKSKPRSPLTLHGKALTPEFRTALYNAWCSLKDEKNVKGWEKTPGLKRSGQQASKRLRQTEMAYLAQIGSEWETQIKGSNTCVGLGIADFAASMGGFYPAWYRTIYAGESQSVHQADMLNYMEFNEEDASFSPRWFTSPVLVKGTLVRAAMIFNQCIKEMHSRFRYNRESISLVQQCVSRLIQSNEVTQ